MNTVEELQEKLTFLDMVLNNSFGNIFVTDGRGIIVYVNDNAANAMLMTQNELVGTSVYDLRSKGSVASGFASITALETKAESTEAVKLVSGVTLAVSARPILDEDDNVRYVVVFSQNREVVEHFMKTVQEHNEIISQTLEHFVKERDDNIVAESKAFKQCRQTIIKASAVDSTILLYGESGTGKEVLARFVHNSSKRKTKMFISVNCAAIPRDLAESEFFGYVKGAFTGSNRTGKIGLFEMADGGTLFLDEIVEMDLQMQSKLLRVLETGEIRKVGDNKNKRVDVRIVAATNKHLSDMVEKGTFREDLYYRLNVIPVIVPPLRERKEDVAALAEYFLKKLNRKYSTNKIFNQDAIETMQSYSWPGNVRELRNIVERLYAVISSDEINAFHLKLHFGMGDIAETTYRDKKLHQPFLNNGESLKDATDAFPRDYIKKIIKNCDGNVVKAASVMGMSKSGLYKKLNSLNMKSKWEWQE